MNDQPNHVRFDAHTQMGRIIDKMTAGISDELSEIIASAFIEGTVYYHCNPTYMAEAVERLLPLLGQEGAELQQGATQWMADNPIESIEAEAAARAACQGSRTHGQRPDEPDELLARMFTDILGRNVSPDEVQEARVQVNNAVI